MIKNLLGMTAIILSLIFTVEVAASNYGPVAAKETLWDIASRNRPSYDVTTQQMMRAIHRANPNAFQNNSVNSLKAGAVLYIPDLVEINKANNSSALPASKQKSRHQKTSKNKARTSKSSRSHSSRVRSSSPSYKRYYKASQRELRKLQKRLKREQRKVRKLKRELAQKGISMKPSSKSQSSKGLSGNITTLQDEVKELEKTIQEKNVHISQLTNMKTVAAETIKKQATINEEYFNRLKAIDPNFVQTQRATSGSLKLQGIDSPPSPQDIISTQSTSPVNSTKSATNKDSGFIIVIAVLSLLFAIALLWRVYTQHIAKKQAFKRDESLLNDKNDTHSTNNRTEPLLST